MKKLICLWIAFCTVITAVLPTAQMTVYAQNSLSETTLRVGTWNIAAKNHPDVKTLSKVISDNDIEIVGVQEVDMFNSRNNYDMMADFISEDLPYIHFAKGRDYAGGDFGIGVVSKYPLLEMNTSPLETYDSLATKVVERTLIEKDGKMIAFYNVHLSVDSSDPRELRQIQIAQIVQRIALDPTEYKIIVGDFNADQDHYEFSRLLDMFNMANGKDGNWIDTYHENDDPNMKEFAIDNILTTKNIQIDDVQIVKNDLSDHYLLYADLTLLDEKAPALRNNLALGATVNTDQEDEVSPYALVDYSYDEGWKSQNPSMITLKLDHTVVQGNLKMYWGEQKASKYKVSISSNGKSWSLCEEVNDVNDVDTVSLGNARYLKIELIEKEKDVFDLREIEVYGTFDESLDEIDIPSSNNILENGGFEEWSEVVKLDNQPSGTWWDTNIWDNNQKAAPWIYQIYQGTEALSKYYMAYKDSEEKVEGNYSVRVEKTAGATKDGFFKLQNYPFTQNQKYRVSFWYKTKDLANNTLILSLFGETKLASSEEWTYFEKEFTATKATETLNMRVNGSNTGVYWLDDYQIVPVVEQDMTTLLEMLQLKTSSYKLALGETTTLVPIYYPTDAEDQEIVWTTSDSNIATVDENGNVKALNRGSVVISAASLSQPLITASVTLTIYSDTIETKKLQDAILVAQTKNEKDYTEESWNRFEEAYNNACQALVSTESQEAIDSALENLLFAQSLLSFVKSKVSEDFYKDMREYWVNEMIGIHDLCDDKDIISVVDELDLQVKKYLETMNDLSDTSIKTIWSDEELLANTGGAEVTVMLDRLKMMAIQTKNLMSDYYQDEEAIASIMEAVQFIVEKRYNKNSGSTTNWWDGEIGTPKSLVDITLIYYDEFIKKNPQFIQDVCEAVDAHIPYANRRGTTSSGLKETGANLIDKVAIVLKRSLLDKNHERLVHAKECMSPLFTLVTSGDGFYKDGSFIFHTNIAYNGSYGAVLIDELVNCVALLNLSDTPIGKKELQFINEQIENAFIPFITYGGNLIDSVRGRAIARYAQQGDTMGTKMMGILLQYAAITDTTTSEMIKSSLKTILDQKFAHDVTQDYSLLSYSDLLRIKSLEKNQDVIGKVSEDNYHQYSYMNKAVAQRRLFTFALSMSSNRIYNTETGNTENTKGYYQGQGMTQIYTEDVNQYNENYWALVDPYRLPGVTSGHQNLSSGTAGQSNWAGGSTLDGINGVSGQIISANKTLNGSKTSGISANKSWFVLDNRIVAIGSNIINSNEEVQQVETILDNRKVEEAVLTDLEGNILGESGISSSKAFLLQDKNHSMGYIVLDGQSVNYLSETRTGSWYDINQLGKFTDHTVREANFVSLAIDHGQATSSANYQYMIIPGANETILKEIVDNPGIEVIEISDSIHALKDLISGQEYYNFFESGSAGDIVVSQPVSMTMKRNENSIAIAVADPCRTLTSVDITINHVDPSLVILSDNAIIKEKTEDSITITLTFAQKDGLSYQVQLGQNYEISSDNYALNKEASASSTVQNANTANRLPQFAVDGDYGTSKFWASEYLKNGVIDESLSDAYFQVDLGEVKEINQVKIFWNTGTGKRYDIQVSKTGEEGSFKTVYSFYSESTSNSTRIDTLDFEAQDARYVRMQGYERTSWYWSGSQKGRAGYTIIEFEVRNSLDLRLSLEKANELIDNYPREVMNHLSDDEFAAIDSKLRNAIKKANEFMNSTDTINEDNLRSIIEELNQAIRQYDDKIIHVSSIRFALDEINLNKYETFMIQPIFEPTNACLKDYILKSSNENIVEILEDGTLYAATAGEAVITAISKDGELRAEVIVKVHVAPQQIELSDTSITLKKNQSHQLQATILPYDTTLECHLVYESEDPSIVQVDEKGNLTALRKGETTIIVKDENLGLSTSCKVVVDLDYTAQSENLALNKNAFASSVVQNSNTANRVEKWAVDGDYTTRWASEYLLNGKEDPIFDKEYITIDLGEEMPISKVVLYWETSKAKDYDVQGSLDGESFFTIYEYRSDDKTQSGRIDELTFDEVNVRYVRMQGIDRSTNYNSSRGGYSLFEFEIYHSKDYFAVMDEIQELLNNYPLDHELTNELIEKVQEIDSYLESEDFNSLGFYQLLMEAEKIIEKYKANIVYVEAIELLIEKTSLLPNEESPVNVKIVPENATIQDYTLTSSDESIVKITENGILAIQPGKAIITAISKDGNFKQEVEVIVRTNTQPVILGEDVTIQVYDDFDPAKDVKAIDAEDGELPVKLVNTNLNTDEIGVYQAIFEVEDSDGNRVSWTRKITVEFDPQRYITSVLINGVKISGVIEPKAQVQVQTNNLEDKLPSKLKNVLSAYLIEINSKLPLGDIYEIVLPGISGYTNVKAYLIDGHEIIELKADFDKDLISLKTSNLGLIVICGVQETNSETPPTEDHFNIMMWVSLVLICLAGIILLNKKHKLN